VTLPGCKDLVLPEAALALGGNIGNGMAAAPQPIDNLEQLKQLRLEQAKSPRPSISRVAGDVLIAFIRGTVILSL